LLIGPGEDRVLSRIELLAAEVQRNRGLECRRVIHAHEPRDSWFDHIVEVSFAKGRRAIVDGHFSLAQIDRSHTIAGIVRDRCGA
jgi:hypothetical protein